MNSKKSVSVIIPAFNEAENLGLVIRQIAELYPDFEIIVVNDGSTDETASAAKDSGAIVYSHPYNLGNGAAIKSGIRIASGDNYKRAVTVQCYDCPTTDTRPASR